MNTVAIILVVIALAAIPIRYVLSRRSTDGGFVTLPDLPKLVDRLTKTGKDGAFWVVLVPATARSDGSAANLQVSIERGVVGMDWVLLAQRNIEDRANFVSLVKAHGLLATEKSMNDVRYLRAEPPSFDLAALCADVLNTMYRVTDATKMQLVVTGFRWP